jgi:cyclase
MHKLRLIARLDIKNEYVIKGIHLEGLRKIGDPIELAKKYYSQGIDEIVFMDAVASLYGRNNLFHIIEAACKEVFIPITIGGGIRAVKDIEYALKSGADKIAINTQAIKNPELIREASRIYGSQCIIGSIEAKKRGPNKWEAFVDNGREETGIDVIEWAKQLEQLGAGEIMVTSIDQEGTKKGFDVELVKQISGLVSIPVIASGGAGNVNHLKTVVLESQAGAIAVASLIHYNLADVSQIKHEINKSGIAIRV